MTRAKLHHIGPHTPEQAARSTVSAPDRHRTVWRALALYEQLEASGQIDKASSQAAERLADLAALADGVNNRDLGGVGGSSGGCPTQTMLDARRNLRDAERALEPRLWQPVLSAATLMQWTDAAQRCGCKRETAKARAIVGLADLARHWQLYGTGARMRAVEIG